MIIGRETIPNPDVRAIPTTLLGLQDPAGFSPLAWRENGLLTADAGNGLNGRCRACPLNPLPQSVASNPCPNPVRRYLNSPGK